MSKGSVLYIGGFELPDNNAAAHRVIANGKLFRELGYQVAYLDIDRDIKKNTPLSYTRKQVQGFECWSVAYPAKAADWFFYITSIKDVIQAIDKIGNVKYVVAYNYPAVALYRLLRECRKRQCLLVADCTEWYGPQQGNPLTAFIKRIDTFLRMRCVHKRLDGVIVISRFLERFYKKCKTVYLPPLVDLNENKWPSEKEPDGGNTLRLLYAGSPGARKDLLSEIIQVIYEKYREAEIDFTIVGLTYEQYFDAHKQQEHILVQVADKVRFLGRLPHTNSLKMLKNSDFSVIIREPTRVNTAGFPTKFVESISAGTPVIASNSSDLYEYMGKGDCGFLLNDALPNTIESCIRYILGIKKKSLDRYCSKIPRETFNYERYIDDFGKFLSAVSSN